MFKHFVIVTLHCGRTGVMYCKDLLSLIVVNLKDRYIPRSTSAVSDRKYGHP